MILGRMGVHTWGGGAIILNDRSLPNHYRLEGTPGLHSVPERIQNASKAVGRPGEVPRAGSVSGKTIGYDGRIIAPDGLVKLEEMRSALTSAFAPRGEKMMVSTPPASYVGPALPTRFFFAETIDAIADDGERASLRSPFSRGYEADFSLVLRMNDPRFYSAAVEVIDVTAEAIGGAGVPFKPGDSAPGETATGFSVVADNIGSAPTDAMITLHGPAQNPVVSNETTGKFLRFKDLTIGSGGSVTIDFRRRRVYRTNLEKNLRSTLDAASTWWGRFEDCLAPGANTIVCRAYDLTAASSLSVSFNPADWS